MNPYALAILAIAVVGIAVTRRRPKTRWNDADWHERLLRDQMSEAEKRYRGIHPYHQGPFA